MKASLMREPVNNCGNIALFHLVHTMYPICEIHTYHQVHHT